MPDEAKRHLLLFDCDPGCDDALAIALVADADLYREVNLLTVAGNVSVDQTTANACRIVSVLDKGNLIKGKISIHRGCARGLMGDLPSAASVHGRDGLGDAPNNLLNSDLEIVHPDRKISAVARLVKESEDNESHFDLLCTGPLTNLATALNLMSRDQRLIFWRRCRRLVIMGGNFGSKGNITPLAEFNTFFDPVATQMVLDFYKDAKKMENAGSNSQIPPMRFVPLNSTERVAVPLDKQNEDPPDAAKFLFYALQQYGTFHAFNCKRPVKSARLIKKFEEKGYISSQLAGSTGVKKITKFCYLHDPLAAWMLLKEDQYKSIRCWEKATIRFDTSRGEGRGQIIRYEQSKDRPFSPPSIGTNVEWLNLKLSAARQIIEKKPSLRSPAEDCVKEVAKLLDLKID